MKRLGVLVSGRGSNLMALLDACDQGRLTASIEIVISNNKDSAALCRAHDKGIKAVYLESDNPEQADIDMRQNLTDSAVDYVLLAGYMKKIGPLTLSAFKNRIFNIHPSLLPKYGGKGMFGMHVHQAVIAAGETETGVTIHMVNDEYDDGAILAQRKVSVKSDDTPESLAARVLRLEHVLFAETIQKVIDNGITALSRYEGEQQ